MVSLFGKGETLYCNIDLRHPFATEHYLHKLAKSTPTLFWLSEFLLIFASPLQDVRRAGELPNQWRKT